MNFLTKQEIKLINSKIERKELQNLLTLLFQKLKENYSIRISDNNISEPSIAINIEKNNNSFIFKENFMSMEQVIPPNNVISSKQLNYLSVYYKNKFIFTTNEKINNNQEILLLELYGQLINLNFKE